MVASLANYPAAPEAILRKLSGQGSSPLAATAARTEAETNDLVETFFAAASQERRLILSNLDAAPATAPRRPAPTSSEVIRRLETAALQRNTGEFSRMLARAIGIGPALAERITRDDSGEPLVVAAKAIRHAGRRVPAHLAVHQSCDRAIGRAGPRPRPAV
ncbi:MAG: hypothetical protein WDN48_04910 [Pseudolabrys sp.]